MLFKYEGIYRYNDSDKEHRRVSVQEVFFSSWEKAMRFTLEQVHIFCRNGEVVDFDSYKDELTGTKETITLWVIKDNDNVYEISLIPICEGYSYGVLEYGNLS